MANPQYVTLVANTVSTVTLDADHVRVEVCNVDGAGASPVYIRIGGTAPAVATDGSVFLPGQVGAAIELPSPETDATIVKLISAGTPKIQVRGI